MKEWPELRLILIIVFSVLLGVPLGYVFRNNSMMILTMGIVEGVFIWLLVKIIVGPEQS